MPSGLMERCKARDSSWSGSSGGARTTWKTSGTSSRRSSCAPRTWDWGPAESAASSIAAVSPTRQASARTRSCPPSRPSATPRRSAALPTRSYAGPPGPGTADRGASSSFTAASRWPCPRALPDATSILWRYSGWAPPLPTGSPGASSRSRGGTSFTSACAPGCRLGQVAAEYRRSQSRNQTPRRAVRFGLAQRVRSRPSLSTLTALVQRLGKTNLDLGWHL